jgi:hypothetical protein
MLVRMQQNRNTDTLLVGMQISTTIMESSMEFPPKEMELPEVILLLAIYPKKYKTGYDRDTCTPMFIATLWKQPRGPTTDEWFKKLWYIYTMIIQPKGLMICSLKVNGSNWKPSC